MPSSTNKQPSRKNATNLRKLGADFHDKHRYGLYDVVHRDKWDRAENDDQALLPSKTSYHMTDIKREILEVVRDVGIRSRMGWKATREQVNELRELNHELLFSKAEIMYAYLKQNALHPRQNEGYFPEIFPREKAKYSTSYIFKHLMYFDTEQNTDPLYKLKTLPSASVIYTVDMGDDEGTLDNYLDNWGDFLEDNHRFLWALLQQSQRDDRDFRKRLLSELQVLLNSIQSRRDKDRFHLEKRVNIEYEVDKEEVYHFATDHGWMTSSVDMTSPTFHNLYLHARDMSSTVNSILSSDRSVDMRETLMNTVIFNEESGQYSIHCLQISKVDDDFENLHVVRTLVKDGVSTQELGNAETYALRAFYSPPKHPDAQFGFRGALSDHDMLALSATLVKQLFHERRVINYTFAKQQNKIPHDQPYDEDQELEALKEYADSLLVATENLAGKLPIRVDCASVSNYCIICMIFDPDDPTAEALNPAIFHRQGEEIYLLAMFKYPSVNYSPEWADHQLDWAASVTPLTDVEMKIDDPNNPLNDVQERDITGELKYTFRNLKVLPPAATYQAMQRRRERDNVNADVPCRFVVNDADLEDTEVKYVYTFPDMSEEDMVHEWNRLQLLRLNFEIDVSAEGYILPEVGSFMKYRNDHRHETGHPFRNYLFLHEDLRYAWSMKWADIVHGPGWDRVQEKGERQTGHHGSSYRHWDEYNDEPEYHGYRHEPRGNRAGNKKHRQNQQQPKAVPAWKRKSQQRHPQKREKEQKGPVPTNNKSRHNPTEPKKEGRIVVMPLQWKLEPIEVQYIDFVYNFNQNELQSRCSIEEFRDIALVVKKWSWENIQYNQKAITTHHDIVYMLAALVSVCVLNINTNTDDIRSKLNIVSSLIKEHEDNKERWHTYHTDWWMTQLSMQLVTVDENELGIDERAGTKQNALKIKGWMIVNMKYPVKCHNIHFYIHSFQILVDSVTKLFDGDWNKTLDLLQSFKKNIEWSQWWIFDSFDHVNMLNQHITTLLHQVKNDTVLTYYELKFIDQIPFKNPHQEFAVQLKDYLIENSHYKVWSSDIIHHQLFAYVLGVTVSFIGYHVQSIHQFMDTVKHLAGYIGKINLRKLSFCSHNAIKEITLNPDTKQYFSKVKNCVWGNTETEPFNHLNIPFPYPEYTSVNQRWNSGRIMGISQNAIKQWLDTHHLPNDEKTINTIYKNLSDLDLISVYLIISTEFTHLNSESFFTKIKQLSRFKNDFILILTNTDYHWDKDESDGDESSVDDEYKFDLQDHKNSSDNPGYSSEEYEFENGQPKEKQNKGKKHDNDKDEDFRKKYGAYEWFDWKNGQAKEEEKKKKDIDYDNVDFSDNKKEPDNADYPNDEQESEDLVDDSNLAF